jgi:membrane protein YqaA with SNARE-associated domain
MHRRRGEVPMDATDLGTWLLVWAVTLVLNVVPAFMPPTWSVLAYFHLREDLAIWPLAAVGATAATAGRTLLALGSRALGARVVPRAWRANIETLAATLSARKTLGLPALALFTLNPVPSNHLIIAAGLARAPLAPIAAVFLVGRFVNYVLWVGAADTAATSLRDVIGPSAGGGPVRPSRSAASWRWSWSCAWTGGASCGDGA